jgi:tRNA pseudouridine13 synthase
MRLLAGSAHFIVDEIPAYAPSGAGEHLYVHIEKEGLTTDDVALALARACGVKPMAVGYAGRKDRHAITTQWFSILGGQEAHLANLRPPAHGRLVVRTVTRHGNKLRVGHLLGNRFRLGLADTAPDLAQRLAHLAATGLANRFGPQRFGLHGANLAIAQAWGRGDVDAAIARIVDPAGAWQTGQPLPDGFRHGPEGLVLGALRKGATPTAALKRADELRKLIASAAQAAIFNAVADARAAAGLTHRLRSGDLACLPNGAPFVVAEADLDDVNRRAATLDVLATGPLPGTWRLAPDAAVADEERAWSAGTGLDWAWFHEGGVFASPGLRRPLVVPFREPPQVEAGDPTWLTFALPAGAFATEVLAQVGVALPESRAG